MTEGVLKDDADKRALEQFLVENPELELLSDKLNDFNLFDVLRATSAEIRHSNILAWLLDPRGTHNFGDAFLRRFLSRVLASSERDLARTSPARAELIDLADAAVEREWRNIDVLVCSAANKLCLLIENKINSSESKGQLRRYFESVSEVYPGWDIIPVFLTLDGDEPSDEGVQLGFSAFSHGEVAQILGQLLERFQTRLPIEVAHLLTQYHAMLKRITMQDEELVRLCRDIYKKHRKAIDLIVEYGAVTGTSDALVESVKKITSPSCIYASANKVHFLTKSLDAITPDEGTTWEGQLGRKSPWTLWLRKTKIGDRLKLCFEVGQVPQSSERQRYLKSFEEAGFKFWNGGCRDDAKFTRIHSEYIKVSNGKTVDELEAGEFEDLVQSLWKRFAPHLEKIERAIKACTTNQRPKKSA